MFTSTSTVTTKILSNCNSRLLNGHSRPNACHRWMSSMTPNLSPCRYRHRDSSSIQPYNNSNSNNFNNNALKIPIQRSFSTSKSVSDNNNNNNNGGEKELTIPGAQTGGDKMAIIYTCTVCNTRAAKQFTKRAYTHGVVLVKCPGCHNQHLIADNLGFFSDERDGWNVEKAMSQLGENVKLVNNDNVLELSVDDLFGEEAIQGAIQGAVSNNGNQEEQSPSSQHKDSTTS